MPYNHRDIETKWIKNWSESNIYKTPKISQGDKKKYILETFPYPSADGLHVGHTEGYTASDITARYFRSIGYKVLYPIGWDAFGLPTENFAKKKGLHPQDVTLNSIGNFKSQTMRLGASYDWEREINTSDSSYYKWTQWFFQLLYKRGLAYKKEALVNWDPVDMTVLANEQVLADGTAERSGAKVEQKMMSQWFFKITDYAERLLDGLEGLDWPESTKLMQKNWIGKSVGAEVEFQVEDEYAYSYLMGAKNIAAKDLENIGIVIIEKTENGNYKLKIPKVKLADYEFLIAERLENGFWNEYISNEIVFIFKSKTGEVEKYNLDLENESLIHKKCEEYADSKFESIKKMIYGNDYYKSILSQNSITVFTTRIDTLFSGTFLILAPDNDLVDNLTTPEQFEEVYQYKEKTKQKSQFERSEMNKEKTGAFTGSYAINPATGDRMPIWISDFVLASYGTGAVFADAHDERDFDMAKKFNIPLKTSLKPEGVDDDSKIRNLDECFSGYGILYNSGQFDGLKSKDAMPKIIAWGESQGWAKARITYRLRDWSIGRQRYWGCPIPVIYDKDGKESLVPELDLPVLLPQDLDLSTGMIKPLRSNLDFINSANQYGEGWTREGDTMDTFVCSSWYFFRYCSGNIENTFANPEDMKQWMPVDQYIIGAEHSTMHLLYARFFTKVLFDAGYINFDEPFQKMRHQGLILGPDNQKMSKSKGNVINPNEVFDEYGADTLRMYEMFMGPFDQPKPWSTSSIKGVRRFLDRVWNLQERIYTGPESGSKLEATNIKFGPKTEVTIETGLNKLIKKIGEDIESYGFNTCVSEFMKFINLVEDTGAITQSQMQRFLIVLAPFAPFITEELWSVLNSGILKAEAGNSPLEMTGTAGLDPATHSPKGWQAKPDGVNSLNLNSIHLQPWPTYDPKLLIESTVTIGVQINGKARGEVELSPSETEESTQKIVMELDFVKRNIEGKTIRKFVYVPSRIVNVVVN